MTTTTTKKSSSAPFIDPSKSSVDTNTTEEIGDRMEMNDHVEEKKESDGITQDVEPTDRSNHHGTSNDDDDDDDDDDGSDDDDSSSSHMKSTTTTTTTTTTTKTAAEETTNDDNNDNWARGPPPLTSLKLSSDHAFGHGPSTSRGQDEFISRPLKFLGFILRLAILDLPLMLIFALYVGTVLLHQIHDDYLLPQLKLMKFIADERDFTDTTYYHRICDDDDITARSVDELLLGPNSTTEDAVATMLTHGASMFPNLLSPETSWALREFIAKENHRQKGWYVIENEYRYSWGIDIDMHPALKTYWKELASNQFLVKSLEAIVGPDPAIIEFTAITSAYGAKDQFDHQDVIPPASGAKFARTFVPSYSLFIPLQDTSYDMGATHICPGTHLCSSGCEENCPARNLAMSGENDNWPQGWGALVNQQTTHKGMGHFKEDGLDRVVIIATFAPRPQTHRALETRMIGQGGSYSIKWDHWGHTFSDFVHAEKRMTPFKRIMRSLGLIKGKGWNLISVASMRISNDDNGYNDESTLETFIEEGGFWFLPKSWQGEIENETTEEENFWYRFLIGTLKRTENGLWQLNIIAVISYAVIIYLGNLIWKNQKRQNGSLILGCILRLVLTHGIVVVFAFWLLHTVRESNWAKDIQNEKAYRLPVYELGKESDLPPETMPIASDILIASQYASDYMSSYSRVLDFSHPGNVFWRDLTQKHSMGYSILPEKLQTKLCSTLVQSVRQERRFLKQDLGRSWVVVEDEKVLDYLCRKDLVTKNNLLIDALNRQLESLRTEALYGRFQNTGMTEIYTPLVLDAWEKIIVPPLSNIQVKKKITKTYRFVPRNVAVIPNLKNSIFEEKTPLPPPPPAEEPYPGAWLQTGDIIEGKYNCIHHEWYKGTVLRALSNELVYMVKYDDGEIDERLRPSCVRRFVPYQINESVEFRNEDEDSNDVYYPGRINYIHEDDDGLLLFDIITEDGYDELYEQVSPANIRRVGTIRPFQVGDRVFANYNQGGRWFPGTIVKKLPSGTFSISYDDGDFERSVSPGYLQHMEDY